MPGRRTRSSESSKAICGTIEIPSSPPKIIQNNFVKPSSEMVPHTASNVILEVGRGEAVTMNGGVCSGVVDKGHEGGLI